MDMESPPIRPDVLNPGARVEHWRILESLGQRGHGAFFRVEDVRRPAGPLVMKISLRPGEGLAEDRTARLMAAHPNLAKLHAYGRCAQPGGDFFYSVREEVRGPLLADWVEAVNPTFLQIAALVSRLGAMIDQVHTRDTWHRELHPHNIQVRETDSEPVLLDLRDGGSETLDSLLKTPLSPELQVFRSPEALRFLRSNGGRPQACYRHLITDDLYSLGALAYWLATGHPPFSPSLSPEQLHTAIELRAPVPPWEVNPRVPKPLGAIILRLMSKLPEARPYSGETLCAELMVAVSAGARMMWARKVFDWAKDEAGQEAIPRRALRPEPPQVSLQPGPRLPRVVYFNPPAERRPSAAPLAASPAAKTPRGFGGDFGGPPGPWSRMM